MASEVYNSKTEILKFELISDFFDAQKIEIKTCGFRLYYKYTHLNRRYRYNPIV